MVMVSRMYLFMHYPTDILGGIAVGIVSVILAHVIMSYLERRKEGRIDGIQ
jgi:undecaprenyl-diphosphatase